MLFVCINKILWKYQIISINKVYYNHRKLYKSGARRLYLLKNTVLHIPGPVFCLFYHGFLSFEKNEKTAPGPICGPHMCVMSHLDLSRGRLRPSERTKTSAGSNGEAPLSDGVAVGQPSFWIFSRIFFQNFFYFFLPPNLSI